MFNDNNSDELKLEIANIINRLIREKNITIEPRRDNQQTLKIDVKIHKPEWYLELNEDIQYYVEYNMAEFLKPLIIEAAKSSRNNDGSNNLIFEVNANENDNCNEDNCNEDNCRHINKRQKF